MKSLANVLYTFLLVLSFSIQGNRCLGAEQENKSTYSTTQKLELVTSLLRLPTNLTSIYYQEKNNTEKADFFRIITNLVRIADGALKIHNHYDRSTIYNLSWLVHDMYDAEKAFKSFFSNKISSETKTLTCDQKKIATALRLLNNLIIPTVETASSFYVAYNNGTTEEDKEARLKITSIGSLARMLNLYLKSEATSLESKIALAAVITHAAVTTFNLIPNDIKKVSIEKSLNTETPENTETIEEDQSVINVNTPQTPSRPLNPNTHEQAPVQTTSTQPLSTSPNANPTLEEFKRKSYKEKIEIFESKNLKRRRSNRDFNKDYKNYLNNRQTI